MKTSVGFPRMHKEKEEKRDFLPSLIGEAAKFGDVFVERGYGGGIGISASEYKRAGAKIVDHEAALSADYVFVIRCPEDDELEHLLRGSTLVTMLHSTTNPLRAKKLTRDGINTVALDSIADDYGNRMVEALRLSAWAGMDVAFSELLVGKNFEREQPINVAIMGTGAMGQNAVSAAAHGGHPNTYLKIMRGELPPVVPIAFGRAVTRSESHLKRVLGDAAILVDATARANPRKHIISNRLLEALPESAVILDLTADRYNDKVRPPIVKAIEGIPTGNLDQYVFKKEDVAYEKLPKFVDTANRRIVVSCYSWPGLRPRRCSEIYSQRLRPLAETLLTKGVYGLRQDGGPYERALYRAAVVAKK